MIRVANVLNAGRFGGPQNRVLQVAVRLREQGIHTSVILPTHDSDEFYARLREADVRAIRLPIHRLTFHKRHMAGFVTLFGPELAALTYTLRRERADIVHCNGASQLKAVFAGRLAGAKVALHLNDTFLRRSINAFHRVTAPLAHGYIYAAERAKQAYPAERGNPDALVHTIPAPVDTVRFDPDAVTPDPVVAAAAGPRVMVAGTLNPAKGLESFAEMAVAVHERRPGATFHVVGPEIESQQAYLREVRRIGAALPGGVLTFHGSSADMPASYGACDVYVCSSIAEASPMSVWEAMSMRLPVVSTDVGDVARYIRDGHNGFVVGVRDVDGLADRVVRLIDDAELRRTVGARARETVVAELDVTRCVERHRAFYEALLARRAG